MTLLKRVMLFSRYTNIEVEFQRIKTNASSQLNNSSYAKILTSGHLMKPLLITMALMFFQQSSGITAILFYSASVFQDAGSSLDRFLSSIIIGVVQVVFTGLSVLLVGIAVTSFLLSTLATDVYRFTLHRWTDSDVVYCSWFQEFLWQSRLVV